MVHERMMEYAFGLVRSILHAQSYREHEIKERIVEFLVFG